jgi:basic amino acid/polyamine antiporter, APA family
VQALWASLLCLSGTYEQLLNYVIFAALVFYVLTAFAVFALRVRRPEAERPVRAPGYPWLPALYLVATAWIGLSMLIEKTTYSALGLLCVLVGVPVYFVWRAVVRPAARTGGTPPAP